MDNNYPLEVERSFKQLYDSVESKNHTATSCDDVLRFFYENQQQIWFMSWDFINQKTKDGRHLSHRAPARASDLAIHEPHLVEDRKIGRFKAYRLRLENLNLIQKRLGLGVTQLPKEQTMTCEHGVPRYAVCPNCRKV